MELYMFVLFWVNLIGLEEFGTSWKLDAIFRKPQVFCTSFYEHLKPYMYPKHVISNPVALWPWSASGNLVLMEADVIHGFFFASGSLCKSMDV
jgi:hypothetical protein